MKAQLVGGRLDNDTPLLPRSVTYTDSVRASLRRPAGPGGDQTGTEHFHGLNTVLTRDPITTSRLPVPVRGVVEHAGKHVSSTLVPCRGISPVWWDSGWSLALPKLKLFSGRIEAISEDQHVSPLRWTSFPSSTFGTATECDTIQGQVGETNHGFPSPASPCGQI